jgi:protein O-mannosyl-transferase
VLGDVINNPKFNAGDRVIFFFAGHGDYDANVKKDQALLLLYGSSNGNYFKNIFKAEHISTSDLNQSLEKEIVKKGGEVILIVDACHSGGVQGKLSGGTEGGIVTANALSLMESSVKFLSCQANQYSIEGKQFGGGRGLFSYVLMEGLYGMADANKDKQINYKELGRYLEDKIPTLADPNKQDPIIKISNGSVVIASVNDSMLNAYVNESNKTMAFVSAVNTKGILEMQLSNSVLDNRMRQCNNLIEQSLLDSAFAVYKTIGDSTAKSTAGILLKRKLISQLQAVAAQILEPLMEDVGKHRGRIFDFNKAAEKLEMANELLGSNHFLYKKNEARILFLRTQDAWIKKQTVENALWAEKQYLKALELEPNASFIYYCLGFVQDASKQYEQALKTFEYYKNLIPNSAWAQFALGRAYDRRGKVNLAYPYYMKSIELDSTSVNTYCNLAGCFKALKKYDSAEIYFKKGIAIKKRYGLIYSNYAVLLRLLDRHDEALQIFKDCFVNDSTCVDCWYNGGNEYYDRKDYAKAEELYKKTLTLDPKWDYAYFQLVCIACKRQDKKLALQNFEEIMKLHANDLEYWSTEKDISFIRPMPEFRAMMEKNFKPEELAKYPSLFKE